VEAASLRARHELIMRRPAWQTLIFINAISPGRHRGLAIGADKEH
jgi:hypothetical protein